MYSPVRGSKNGTGSNRYSPDAMKQILHAVHIHAAPSRVYRDLTTGADLASGWTKQVYLSLLPLAHSLRNFARSWAMFFVSAINFPIESPPATPMTPIRRCWKVANVAPSADLIEPSTVTPDLPAPKPTT